MFFIDNVPILSKRNAGKGEERFKHDFLHELHKPVSSRLTQPFSFYRNGHNNAEKHVPILVALYLLSSKNKCVRENLY